MKRPLYIRSALAGLSDGIAIPLVAAAALTGAGVAYNTRLLIIALIVTAGALLLSLAHYLTVKEEQDDAVHEHHFTGLDLLPGEEKELAARQLLQEQKSWQAETASFSKQLSPVTSAVIVFVFYGLGGTLLLMLFWLTALSDNSLLLNAAIAFAVLFLVGSIKGRLDQKKGLAGAMRLTLTAIAAATAAYGAGYLFTMP